ncbi:TetR/AcrR family transcriptional regulator [Microbacterium sp. F51-2R]|uniref:TetR/AcrR family transcriptional regulator n=1 Tax=Microbacterium sp. F51-2R TaxID=3445777 RepID=UPI003FA121F3
MLDAALEVFAAKGFRGSSLDDIAQRSGVGRSALLYHFRSKEGVLVALLERRDAAVRVMQEVSATGSGSPAADLLSAIRTRSPEIRRAVNEMKLAHALEAEAADADHPAREWVAARAVRIRGYFAEHFSRESLGQSNSVVDPAALAAVTLAVIEGLEAQWLIDPESIDFDAALEVYEALVLSTLHASAARAGQVPPRVGAEPRE